MKSSISTPGTSPSVAPPTRSFLVLLADGSRLRVTDRDLAVQLRQERSTTLKRLRQARAEALADIADRIGEARIRREFEAAEREMDVAIRSLSKQVRVKPQRQRSTSSTRSPRSASVITGHSGIVITRITTSVLARRDSLGREGIMLRIRYVRAGGKHASPGCLRRHYSYIARVAAVTLDSNGTPIVLGNLGDTVDDIAAALDLQEKVLRAMRKNAKLGFRIVGAFPYGLPVDARREIIQRIGDELFGKRGLPWTGAAHDADAAASVDNPHFHLDYSTLPMELLPDGSFVVSNDLRTDLDGQEGLRFIRHSVARVMTEVAQEYGLDRSFTALSYRERGMDREGGEHVGQEGTAAHRRGEYVASIARNGAKRRLAEAREKSRRARDRLDALEQLKRAIEAMPAPPELTIDLRGAMNGSALTLAIAPAIIEPDSAAVDLPIAPAPRMTAVNLAASWVGPSVAPQCGDGPRPTATASRAAAGPSTLPTGATVALPPAAPVMAMPTIGNAGPAVFTTRKVPTPAVLTPPAPVPGQVPTCAPAVPAAPSVDPEPILALRNDGAVWHRGAPLTKTLSSNHEVAAQSPPIMSPVPFGTLPPVVPVTPDGAIDRAIDTIAVIADPAPTVTLMQTTDRFDAAPEPVAQPPRRTDLEQSPLADPIPWGPEIRDTGASVAATSAVPACGVATQPAPVLMHLPPIAAIPTAAPSKPDNAMGIVTIIATAAPTIKATPTLAVLAAAPAVVPKTPVVAIIASGAPVTTAALIVDLPRRSAPHVVAVALPHSQWALAPLQDPAPAAGVGNTAPGIALPPAVTQIGRPACVPITPAPIIWYIGKPASSDADERNTEKQLKELIQREQGRRRDADACESTQRDLSAGLAALRRLDEWLGQDEVERYTVSDAALHASGLAQADLAIPAMQSALEAMRMQQVERLRPLLDDRSDRATLHVEGGVIRLDERFARELCDDVARWGSEPSFRAFVSTAWPHLRKALGSSLPVPAVPQVAQQDRRQLALEAMFAAIAKERHSLKRQQGVPVVDATLLSRFGLVPADIAADDARKRFADLAEQQAVEKVRIANYVKATPQSIVPDGDGWLLDDAAPADVRLLVAAWRNDTTMQQALGRVVAAKSIEISSHELIEPVAGRLDDASHRVSARAVRERVVAEDDPAERLERSALAQPSRPNMRASAEPGSELRRRRIDEACRILLHSPRRPYGVQDGRAFLDLDVMGRRERNAVAAVGLGEREVADALIARVRRDRAEDERTRTASSSATTPLDRVTILGRIADEQLAAAGEWVASGRLDAPGTARTGLGAALSRGIAILVPLPQSRHACVTISGEAEPSSHR